MYLLYKSTQLSYIFYSKIQTFHSMYDLTLNQDQSKNDFFFVEKYVDRGLGS